MTLNINIFKAGQYAFYIGLHVGLHLDYINYLSIFNVLILESLGIKCIMYQFHLNCVRTLIASDVDNWLMN